MLNAAVALASWLVNVTDWPWGTVGAHRFLPRDVRSPGLYWNCLMLTPVVVHVGHDWGLAAASAVSVPPWWRFSCRGPWVRWPLWWRPCLNGLTPPSPPGAQYVTMIPIDSYHEARLVS